MKKLGDVIGGILSDIDQGNIADYGMRKNFGLTQGQVLHTDADTGQLTMIPCWMKICATYNVSKETYDVNLIPVLQTSPQHYAKHECNSLDEAIADRGFLDYLADIDISGGETIIPRHAGSVFPHDVPDDQAVADLKSDSNMEIIPEFRVAVYKDMDELVIQNAKGFFPPQPGEKSFANSESIRKYAVRPIWTPCLSQDEEQKIFFSAEDTCISAILIPTMWLIGEKTYRFFLDFAGDWQSQENRIYHQLGPFTITHYVEDGKGWAETAIVPKK